MSLVALCTVHSLSHKSPPLPHMASVKTKVVYSWPKISQDSPKMHKWELAGALRGGGVYASSAFRIHLPHTLSSPTQTSLQYTPPPPPIKRWRGEVARWCLDCSKPGLRLAQDALDRAPRFTGAGCGCLSRGGWMRFMHKLLSAQGELDGDKVLLLPFVVSVSFVFVGDLWLLVACRSLLLGRCYGDQFVCSCLPACLPGLACVCLCLCQPACACA